MSDERTDGSGRRSGKRSRGVFERPKRSGAWWILYYDEQGRRQVVQRGVEAWHVVAEDVHQVSRMRGRCYNPRLETVGGFTV